MRCWCSTSVLGLCVFATMLGMAPDMNFYAASQAPLEPDGVMGLRPDTMATVPIRRGEACALFLRRVQ